MQEFFTVAGVHFLAVAAPGQDFAWVVRQSIKNGRGSGLMAALGISAGVLLFCLAAVFGLELIMGSPHLIDVAKLAGAGYLFGIGWQMKGSKPGQNLQADGVRQENPAGIFFQSCLVNLSNIKAIFFFFMVFSTLVSPQTSTGIRFFYTLWMGIATFAWFAFVATVFGNELVRRKFISHFHKIEIGTGWLFMLLAGFVVFDVLQAFGNRFFHF